MAARLLMGARIDHQGEGIVPAGDQRSPGLGELAGSRGAVVFTVLTGVTAVVAASAEWAASEQPLASPTGILWSVVGLLGVTTMLVP